MTECKHHWDYVKTEYSTVPGGTNMLSTDLVICTVCGKTNRV